MPAVPEEQPVVRRAGLILLASIAFACTSVPVVNPTPIAAAGTPSRTRIAILRGIVRSHWTVVSEKPGEVVASLDRSAWGIVVAIDYGPQVSIRYLRSHGMDYDDSSDPATIHRGYNKRVHHLMAAIAQEMTLQGIPEG